VQKTPPKRARADRADRTGLSREQVLDAALDLVDRDGVAALSMRRLGAELGVEAMTLYHYLPNKDALLDGIVERVMAQADTTLTSGPWDRALTDYARSLRATLLRHPGAALIVATRPAVTPETLRAAERGLTCRPKVSLLRGPAKAGCALWQLGRLHGSAGSV
jgi:AcrR family transcriptional regulator